ncbi:hypothetical protein CsSME_00047222 [Camellia sinensis var. sinensis]
MVATGPTITSLGPNLEAGVYKTGSGLCAVFLANVDSQSDATVNFNGNSYNLPTWSVSILPDCKNIVLNTAKTRLKGEELCLSGGGSSVWVSKPTLPKNQPLIWYKCNQVMLLLGFFCLVCLVLALICSLLMWCVNMMVFTV